MPKYLVVGDIHVKTDNVEETEIFMTDLGRYYYQEKPDKIVLLGDILHHHEKVYTQSLNRALDIIKRCSEWAWTIVLVGNHDFIGNNEFLTQNHWMNSLKVWPRVTIVDDVLIDDDVIFVPYVYPGRFIEAIETKTKNWVNSKVIFAHQELKGCKMGAIESQTGDSWMDDWPQVISGHIHDCQKIGKKIYYPGAPLQHAFGDISKRVICLVDSDTQSIKELELQVPKKYVVKTDIQGIQGLGIQGKTKLKIKASQEEFKLYKKSQEYKELIDLGVKFQLEKNIEKIDKTEHKSSDFESILWSIVQKDGTELILDLYNELILDRILI